MSRNPDTDWQPAATPERLRVRAAILAQIREFLARNGVLEVETPILSSAATTDPNIQSLATRYHGPGAASGRKLYLQTSPELFMKRLLAAGSGPIYQISRVFRDGEVGRYHNPEFTLLEWYRPGFDHQQLMDEVESLVSMILPQSYRRLPVQHLSYAQAFANHTGIPDVHRATTAELRDCAREHGIETCAIQAGGHDAWLDLLMGHLVIPALGHEQLCFVAGFPASQAALARVRPGSPALAERFELYVAGLEIANGFHELIDAAEQRRRFEAELAARHSGDLPPVPIDEHFLAALLHGLPECAGVALGVDRLIMLASGAEHISEVLGFPVDRV